MPPNSNHPQVPYAKIVGESKRIIVGVDFGTSTTKVVYRPVELGAQARLVDFAHSHRKFLSYAMPSSVRLDNQHRLWFGTEAEDGDGQVFRSFKVCVACQVGAIPCRGCNQNTAVVTPPQGRFADLQFGFIPAHELMAYYLAWLLQEASEIILREVGESAKLELQYNLGVPVAHVNAEPELVHRFEWILHTSVTLRGQIKQGISMAQARGHLINILPEAILPLPEYRRHRALPETAAAAMWLQKTGDDVSSASYMLIDIGAGTTDITIYRHDKANPDTLPIYGVRSVPIAGDNVDFSTARWFARKCGKKLETPSQLSSKLLQEIRSRKESLPRRDEPMEAIIGRRRVALDEQSYIEEIVNQHASDIHNAASDAFSDAYKLAHHERHWPEMRIVLLGGGSRINGMRRYFEKHPLRQFMRQHVLESQILTNEDLLQQRDHQLLVVAYGLAFPAAEFPSIRMPNQIPPIQQPGHEPEREYNANALLSN